MRGDGQGPQAQSNQAVEKVLDFAPVGQRNRLGCLRLWNTYGETNQASLIYRRTKNLRAVQLLLGHSKLESTVRYLGIEVDDALEMAEQTEV